MTHRSYHNVCLLFLILTTAALKDWLSEPEENYKSRRSLRSSWQGLGRLQDSLLGFRDVWAGQYRPNKAVRWVSNTLESEVSVGEVDLCGHSCTEGVALFGFSVCQVNWQVGCPDTEPPEGVKLETQLYDLCPKECDLADPEKQGNAQAGGDVLDHIKVWTAADGKHWEKSDVRIELMPQPNPNTQPKKPKRDHKCVCTGCPKPEKKEIKVDPEKLARAKGKNPQEAEEDTEKERVNKLDKELDGDEPEVAVGGDFEWVLSGTEDDANAGKTEDTAQTKATGSEGKQGTCPQCCLNAFKSDWNHVIFHDLNEVKQDEPELESGIALISPFPDDSEEH